MNYDCNVNIIDMVMGSGKTTAAINHINAASDDEKFIYITPYLSEIERIQKNCPDKHFKDPKSIATKLDGIKYLIGKGENIVSTHALFRRFDNEVIDMCRVNNYTLIMDEVTDVIEPYYMAKNDFNIMLENFAHIDTDTGLIRWNENCLDYKGKFSEEKRLCELGCLAYYSGSIMMWLFPIEVFNAFRNVYILTYMFNAQLQRYYYDYYKLPYKYLYVKGNSLNTYYFTEDEIAAPIKYDVNKLIHILDNSKLNQIGDRETDLSKNWYIRNKGEADEPKKGNVAMQQLKHNLDNYFKNITKTKTGENLWTTFSEFKSKLSGSGYTKAFCAVNMRASNDYKDRYAVAYPVNRYINPCIIKFFMQHNVEPDEDGYALSEMLQFIWRSAIRDGKEIWVYVPSIRMRRLFQQWINEQSELYNAANGLEGLYE